MGSQTERNIHALLRVQVVKQPFNYLMPYIPRRPFSSVGTGFIVKLEAMGSDTCVTFMTAAHVIADAQRVTVRFPTTGSQRFDAVVKRTSNKYDMALLTTTIPHAAIEVIKPTVMRLATQAEIRDLERGEQVQAYGYPDGLKQPKASAGVFNGLERHELMHDAATSPGSSGGPLLCVRLQKVIGVVSWKIVKSGVEGVQFTMPVLFAGALAESSLPRGVPKDTVFVPSLFFGVCVQQTDDIVHGGQGARVYDVMENSAAALAGLKKGDIMTSFDGMALNAYTEAESTPWTRQTVPVAEIMFSVFQQRPFKVAAERDGKRVSAKPLVPQPPRGSMVEYAPPFTAEPSFITIDGLCLMTSCRNLLSSRVGGALQEKTPSDVYNKTWVVVTDVGEGSRADELSDVLAGMIVETVNGKAVSTVEDVVRCVHGADRIEIAMEDGRVFGTTRAFIQEWWKVVEQRGGKPTNV